MKNLSLLIKTALLIGLFCNYLLGNLYAQKEDLNWVCPPNVRIRFDSIPQFFETYPTYHASALSDKEGNFLFYPTVGEPFSSVNFWFDEGYSNFRDSSGKLFINSDSIQQNSRSFNLVLLEDPSKIGFFHSVTYYTEPFYSNVPYVTRKIIHATLRYHLIGFKPNRTEGEVLIKNQKLYSNSITQRIHEIRHANGRDWWIVAHERDSSNKFLFFSD